MLLQNALGVRFCAALDTATMKFQHMLKTFVGEHMRSGMFALLTAGTLVAVTSFGCASEGPKPTDELTKAHVVIDQADKSGTAQRYAAADLQRAHDELSAAERLSAQKKYDEARAQAQRAAVDADLALARGNSSEQQKAAEDVVKANDTLSQEIQRKEADGAQQ